MRDFLFLIRSGENLTEAVALCLRKRPLPEEEELEDELFAGASEEEPGNETQQKPHCCHNKAISDELLGKSWCLWLFNCQVLAKKETN